MNSEKKIERVAAYCRVSTTLDNQDGSYEQQMEYYRKKIEENPNMELVNVYGDHGKSACNIKGRPAFQKMIQDCKDGKIDRILTKSISRFARNAADCVETIHILQAMGVSVYFEKEGFSSTDSSCELLLSILAAFAQEESNSIRENMILSYAQQASEGRPYGSVSYGYERTPDLQWHIKEPEAKRVRYAFEQAACGTKYAAIRDGLNQMEQQEQTGIVWRQDRLHRLLTNVAYMGDYFSHQTVSVAVGHQVKNRGLRDRYYIEEHHEPIISRPVFQRVQQLIRHRLLAQNRKTGWQEAAILNDTSWKGAEREAGK